MADSRIVSAEASGRSPRTDNKSILKDIIRDDLTKPLV